MSADSSSEPRMPADSGGPSEPASSSDRLSTPERRKVVIFDLDDTITYSTMYKSLENSQPTPEGFFVPGALDLIEKLKESGVTVGVISNSYGHLGHQPRLEAALAEKGVALDFFVSIEDIHIELWQKHKEKNPEAVATYDELPPYNKSTIDLLSQKYAKPNPFMFIRAMYRIGTTKPSELDITVVGDGHTDVRFANTIKGEFPAIEARALHIDIHRDDDKKPDDAWVEWIECALRHRPNVSVGNFKELGKELQNHLKIDLGYAEKPKPIMMAGAVISPRGSYVSASETIIEVGGR